MRSFAPAALLLALLPTSAFAATVRPDRPRILLSNGSGPGTSLATFQARCTSDAAYQKRCQNAFANADAGGWPAMGHAAAYLVNGTASECAAAFAKAQSLASDTPGSPDPHSFISNHGRTMVQLAAVRDWCDAALSASDDQWLEDRIAQYTDWYLANADGLDVWHDDMNNVWSSVALAGLTLKGTSQDAKADTYLAAAEKQWKNVIFPALAYEGDFWHEGFVYAQPSLATVGFYALAWSTATDEDMFAWAKTNAKDVFSQWLAFHAYSLRPDPHYFYFGDVSDNKQSVELFSRYLVDMLTLGTGSALGQGLSLEIEKRSKPAYDYAGADGYLYALFHDAAKDASATPLASLPTARWMSRGAADVVTMRSGWGPDDTAVFFSCGDYFGAHQHDEVASFQIYRHAILTGPTGYYDAFDSDHWANYYSQHSVHANTIAVYAPGEVFPTSKSLNDPSANVNDGGQRVLRLDTKGDHYPNPDLPTYLQHKTTGNHLETGDVKAFSSSACYDFVACDATAAYDSTVVTTNGNTAKLSEASRELVFLKPQIVVVFDRVESTDASYEKRFLLHAPGGTPQVSGASYVLDDGQGRLYAETLLPADPAVATRTNFEVEGKPHPPSETGAESGGTRLEISPKEAQKRDYFLHVFDATDTGDASPPIATATEDDATATVTIDDGTTETTIAFAKTGPLGGHIVSKTKSDGTVLCDEDLGASGAPTGAGGGGAGSGGGAASGTGGAAAASGAGGGDAAKSSGDDGGCGFRAAGGAPAQGPAALGVVLLFALGARRRRRR